MKFNASKFKLFAHENFLNEKKIFYIYDIFRNALLRRKNIYYKILRWNYKASLIKISRPLKFLRINKEILILINDN